MPVSAAQYETMLRYLDNELSEEEEVLFINQMAADSEMQRAFDMELLLQQKYSSDEAAANEEDAMFESPDNHIERVKNITANDRIETKDQPLQSPVIPVDRYRRLRTIAAAAILIITGSILFYTYADHKNYPSVKMEKSFQKDVNQVKDSSREKQLLTENITLPEIGQKFYAAYKGTAEDPVEASLYLDEYKRRKYDQVLKAEESDMQTKGSNDITEQKLSENYLKFYKSLSYLETSKPAKAVELLKEMLRENKSRNSLYYQSEWYLLMAYLRLNDKENVQKIITTMSAEKNNPNRKRSLKIAELVR